MVPGVDEPSPEVYCEFKSSCLDCMSSNCDYNRSISSRHLVLSIFVVFAVIMAGTPVGFPVPQMQEGLDDREALDCFILDYIDYCTVMGWFVPKAGCKYDSGSKVGVAQ